MMRGRPVLVSSVALLIFVICPLNAQLADNLIVSGSDKPMAYGVGTYGLKGAGTQGTSGQSEAGGLYSAKIPTFTMSKSVPGVIVSDGPPSYTNMCPIPLGCIASSQHAPSVVRNYEPRCASRVLTKEFEA